VSAQQLEFANETKGFNLIPFAVMAGGWLAPLIMFWLYIWGPLRPFHYPAGDLAPSLLWFSVSLGLCIALWWLPQSYYRVYPFERSGRVYVALGVRHFRALVPDGDLAQRYRRRNQPEWRIIRNRSLAAAFVTRTQLSEKSHLVLLAVGFFSAAYAWHIGWQGWATYLGLGNVVTNIYPILLQRFTRSRLESILGKRH
jgi:hypothetical protein